jgi:hypothetical protein
MSIKITTTIARKEERDIVIPVPSFWKEPTTSYDCYRAVLDDKTYVEVTRLWDGEIVHILNSTVERRHDRIIEANDSWLLCSERDFMQAYDDAFEAIRLKPTVIDTGREEALLDYQRENRY